MSNAKVRHRRRRRAQSPRAQHERAMQWWAKATPAQLRAVAKVLNFGYVGPIRACTYPAERAYAGVVQPAPLDPHSALAQDLHALVSLVRTQ